MYPYADKTDTFAPSYAKDLGPISKEAPLTVLLKDFADSNISTANRIYNMLHELRGRLLGTAPSPVGTDPTRTEPHCFAAAMNGLNNDLARQLGAIEALTEEIANRL